MRKMIAFLSTGFAGMDACEALLVEDTATEYDIDQDCWFMALFHAENYGIYPPNENDEDEDSENTSDNIEGYAVDYVPELHDMHRSGGGSFQDDFAHLMR